MSQANDPPPVRRALIALAVGAVMGAIVAAVVPRELGGSDRAPPAAA